MLPVIDQLLESSAVHAEWRGPLTHALKTVDQGYLRELMIDQQWLPGINRLFSAFQRDLLGCRYILFGESPYPRRESANGIAFYDAAVTRLWSDKGLSKSVNRATSLRNIMKTALLAQGLIQTEADGRISQSMIAQLDRQKLIQTIDDLFTALHRKGFLLFNATPVLHPERKPSIEARYWLEFVNSLLQQIGIHRKDLPTLVLWGKIARQIEAMPAAEQYPKLSCEHPYNLSFINNRRMLRLFSDLQILSLHH